MSLELAVFQQLISKLQSPNTDTEVTAALQLIPSLPQPITPAQAELIWAYIPSPYLSKLAASSLLFEDNSIPLLVTILSCVRTSPSVLNSLSYLSYAPVLLHVAYCPQDSVAKEIRQLSMECLECVSYIPECQSILLHEAAIGKIITSTVREDGLSLIVLSNLQQSDEFWRYSHQVIDALQQQLSSREQLGKYNYCEHINRVLSYFEQFQFGTTESLSLLLRDLLILIRHKVEASSQLLVLLATTQLFSLLDLYALCEHLSANKGSKFSLNDLVDLLLLIANLVVVNFKLWLDEYMQSGENKFSQSSPMIAYTQQLIRMLERVEENDCLVLKSTDKCFDFICKSLLTIEDIFVSLCHLLMYAQEKADVLNQDLSHSILTLLSLYLADHELTKHTDLLTKLCPILTQLMCNIPMSQFYGEINKFDFSLLQNNTSLSNFLLALEHRISASMLEFLPAALNLSQHSQLSLCLAESGYLHLLLAFFSKLYITPLLNKTTPDNNSDLRSTILDIILTLHRAHTVSTAVLKLTLSLLLISRNKSGNWICQAEHKLISLLMESVSLCDTTSDLPQELTALLPAIQTTTETIENL